MRIRTHTNPFCCRRSFKKLSEYDISLDCLKNLDFEIGFGRGKFIRNYAKQNPQRFIVGVDVRTAVVDLLNKRIKEEEIDNVLALVGNGQIVLDQMFENVSLDNIFIFHPDPWVKKRHHKRRIINKDFLDIAKNKLKQNGKIHVSTDAEFLWEDILETFAENDSFVLIENDSFWSDSYVSRWNEISQDKERKTFYATFGLRL